MTDWGFLAFAVGSTLSLAAGGVLLIAGYIGTVPAAFASGMGTGLVSLLLPVAGPAWFAVSRGAEFRRPLWQLVGGLALVVLAGGLILGLGPHFAEQLAAEAIEAAKNR